MHVLRWMIVLALGAFVSFSAAWARPAPLTVDYNFDRHRTGARSEAGLTIGADGALYGATISAGRYGYGSLYRRDPNGRVVVRHWFNAETGVADGRLTLLPDGSLWGVSSGGAYGHGAVFRFDPATVTLRVVHSFRIADGSGPRGALLLASDDLLYGTTERGGTFYRGAIFRIDPITGVLTSLYSFSRDRFEPGNTPSPGLAEGPDGMLYGGTMASFGGYGGSVFRFDRATHQVTVVHTFDILTEGSGVQEAPLIAPNGRMYGILSRGSTNAGRVFTLSVDGSFATLHDFTPGYGSPHGGLMRASDGYLYGTTIGYGNKAATKQGTVYRLAPDGSRFNPITNFQVGDPPYARAPHCELIEYGGMLWGTTFGGGPQDDGTIFRLERPPAP